MVDCLADIACGLIGRDGLSALIVEQEGEYDEAKGVVEEEEPFARAEPDVTTE